MFPWNIHELRQSRARSNEHCGVTLFFHQLVEGHGSSDYNVGFKLHAHGTHVVNLLADDLLGQPELGDAIHQHAARCVQRLEYMNLVSLLDQIARSSQAGGTAAHDGDLLSRRRRFGQVADIQMALLIVGDETLQISNPQRLNLLAHQTAAFAVVFLRAHPPGDGRQHIVFTDFGGRAHEVASHDQLHEVFHFDAHRTLSRAYWLGTLQAAQRFLPRQFLGIAQVHFGEISGTHQRRLLQHVLPGHLHSRLQWKRIQRGLLGGLRHRPPPCTAQAPFCSV